MREIHKWEPTKLNSREFDTEKKEVIRLLEKFGYILMKGEEDIIENMLKQIEQDYIAGKIKMANYACETLYCFLAWKLNTTPDAIAELFNFFNKEKEKKLFKEEQKNDLLPLFYKLINLQNEKNTKILGFDGSDLSKYNEQKIKWDSKQ